MNGAGPVATSSRCTAAAGSTSPNAREICAREERLSSSCSSGENDSIGSIPLRSVNAGITGTACTGMSDARAAFAILAASSTARRDSGLPSTPTMMGFPTMNGSPSSEGVGERLGHLAELPQSTALQGLDGAGPVVVEDRVELPSQRGVKVVTHPFRSEEHTSELQSRRDLVCRL